MTPPADETTFAEWVESRKDLTEDEIFAIEAMTQGLIEAKEEPEPEPPAKGELTFTEWVEERKKLTEDEIFAIEAATQGLVEAKKLKVPTPKKPTVKPELIITRTPYPKWWKDSLNAKIELTAPGSATLATVSGNLRLFVATIVITVTGETVITITFGTAGSSGPIYLGGTDQPMGIVIAMGNSPAPCGSGPLTITATDPGGVEPSIGGFATCFAEEA